MPPPYIPSLEVVKKKAILSMRLSDYFCAHCVCLRPFGLVSYSCVNGFIGQAKINRLCIINQKGRSRTLLQANSLLLMTSHTLKDLFFLICIVQPLLCVGSRTRSRFPQEGIMIFSLFFSCSKNEERPKQHQFWQCYILLCSFPTTTTFSTAVRIKKLSKSKNFPQLPQAFYLICVSLARASASVDIVHFQTV